MTSLNQALRTQTCVESDQPQGGIFSVLSGFASYLRKRRKQKEERQAFNAMLYLDNHMLDDIGVSRADVEWASRLPLSTNAAEELRRLSQKSGTLYL